MLPVLLPAARTCAAGLGPYNFARPTSHFALPRAAAPAPPEASVLFESAESAESLLPQRTVNAILEDHLGFLWFGTREGLARWDGYEMRSWKLEPFQDDSLPDNVVTEMVEDSRGNLWVETEAGLGRLSADRTRLKRYSFVNAHPFLDAQGDAWLAHLDRLLRWDAERDRFEVVAHLGTQRQEVKAHSAAHDRAGRFWLGDLEGGLHQCDPGGQGCRLAARLPWKENCSAVIEDRSGDVLVGTTKGIYRLDDARRELVPLPNAPSRLMSTWVNQLDEDALGNVWLATYDGVYRYRPQQGSFDQFDLDPGNTRPDPSRNLARALEIDQAGNVWIGAFSGLYRHAPNRKPFEHIGRGYQGDGLAGSISALYEQADGTLWIGTIGAGLQSLEPTTGRVRRYRHDPNDSRSLASDTVWSIAQDAQGSLWIGTSLGLSRFDPPQGRFDTQDFGFTMEGPLVPSESSIHALTPDARGKLWIGTGRLGLAYIENGKATVATELLPEPAFVQAILPLSDGSLWVGTGAGLYFVDPQRGICRQWRHDPSDPRSLSDDGILSLHLDAEGRLWVGTENGLNLLLSAEDRFEHFGALEGLPSDTIYGILDDPRGRLWISTNRGLARLRQVESGFEIRSYDVSEKGGNREFNRGAFLRGADNRLYFGGDRGITVFNPSTIDDSPYLPPVVLTGVRKTTREGTRVERAHRGRIEVDPDEYTVVFHIAALHFTRPEQVRYAARLEGWDADWIPLGDNREATYTNLPPGRYTFRAKASNEDGIWSPRELSIAVTIHPPFWKTGWFLTLMATLAVGLVAGGGWFLSRIRYRRQLLELRAQQALERERGRISRDMHDEVGASLSEIAILSELAQRRLGSSRAEEAGLGKIAERSRSLLDSIGEIVWAINPHNDDLASLVAYLREYAAEYLEGTSIDCRLDFPETAAPGPVSAEFRRNVFLVLKEALHNVVKHSQASEAEVRLRIGDGRLLLSIQDNGVGLEPPPISEVGPAARKGGGNGLRNMHHRAESIRGSLEIASSPGAGTVIRLSAPLSPKRAF